MGSTGGVSFTGMRGFGVRGCKEAVEVSVCLSGSTLMSDQDERGGLNASYPSDHTYRRRIVNESVGYRATFGRILTSVVAGILGSVPEERGEDHEVCLRRASSVCTGQFSLCALTEHFVCATPRCTSEQSDACVGRTASHAARVDGGATTVLTSPSGDGGALGKNVNATASVLGATGHPALPRRQSRVKPERGRGGREDPDPDSER